MNFKTKLAKPFAVKVWKVKRKYELKRIWKGKQFSHSKTINFHLYRKFLMQTLSLK